MAARPSAKEVIELVDVEELRRAPIAILGGGAVGKTCGADCALAGQEVRICDLDPFFDNALALLCVRVSPCRTSTGDAD